jgi:tRNA(Ile)-lysidine synthase
MVLLHALHAIGFTKLVVCHLDHGLRGRSSAADARLVQRTAAKLGVAFELGEADVKSYASVQSISLELAARELRWKFFESCARAHRCKCIAFAHHAGDQVETCLFNFLRGTGAAGLAGMRPTSKIGSLTALRPFLGLTRVEIEAFAKQNKIPFREDRSNTSRAHTRNRLRHDVIPTIESAIGPNFSAAVLRASEIFRVENDWMESLVPETGAKLSCKTLRAMPPALQRRTVLRWLRGRGVEAGFAETELVLSLLDTEGPAKINLPEGRHARRRAGEIFFE